VANDLRTLGKRMNALADSIPKRANELKKKVVMTIVSDLAYSTPVDTSQAISNYQVNTVRPETAIKAHFQGERGSTYQASARETIDRARTFLETVQPGQAVYISNVLPYIIPLNNGTSTQEPAGFIERAVLLGRKEIVKFRLLK